MSKIAVLVVLVSLAVPSATCPSIAQAQDTVIQPTQGTQTEQRQRAQEQQIQQGAARGAIDPGEAARLLGYFGRIQRAQERAYSDGLLTIREQRYLERHQTRLQRDIDRAVSR